MPQLVTSAGPVDYADTAGPGPPILLVPGLAMDRTLWRKVVADLAPDHRVVSITLPLGSHPEPMREDADLTLHGLATIQCEVIDRLDLDDLTLVGNDSGAYLLTAMQRRDRIRALVISTCEAFDHFPPGLPGAALTMSARLPGGVNLTLQTLRVPALRRSPMAYGWMAKRPIPHAVTDGWIAPMLHQPRVRRDLVKYLRTSTRREMVDASLALSGFPHPTLVLWTPEDRVMDRGHGKRLADLIPQAGLVQVSDSYTLIPEDQPKVFADNIRAHVAGAAS